MGFIKKRMMNIILIVLGVFSILLLLAFFNYSVQKNIEKEMRSNLEDIRNNAIFMLNNEIDHFSDNLEHEARFFNLLGPLSDGEILEELQNFPKNESMPRAHIMMLDGKVYSSLDGSIKQYNPDDFKEILHRKKGGVSNPRFSQTLHNTIVAISTPLYINNTYCGLLIGNYDIGDFETLFLNNFLDGTCSISLATSDGTMISRSGMTPMPKNFKKNIFDFYFRDDVKFIEGTPTEMRNDLTNHMPGYKTYINDGVTHYLSYAPVGINDWYIAAVSTNQTLAHQSAAIKNYAFQLTLGVFMIMLVAAALVIAARSREQHGIQKFLEEMASTDPLTKIYNKIAVEHEIDDFLQRHGKNGKHALLMIDIDGFKHINDCLGHAKGDEILQEFSVSMKTIFGDRGILGRVGGDEFVVLLKNYGEIETITEKSDEIRNALRKTHGSKEQPNIFAQTSASIGIALYKKDGLTYHDLYRNADLALYLSKNAGRDRHTFQNPHG
ncbi:MAG: sensor domain-containing diguanylate cyclase [Anaerovorax sp.]